MSAGDRPATATEVGNALYERANTLRREGKHAEAIAIYRKIIEQNPRFAPAHNNMGIAFFGAGKLDEAMACYRQAIQIDPAYSRPHNNLGTALAKRHELKEAEEHFRKAIELEPDSVSAHFNLANCLQEGIRLEEAIAAYERALALAPTEARYRWNYSVALLMAGHYDRGWKEYEARWEGCAQMTGKRPDIRKPEWNGEDIKGKTILLHCEQGLGDSLQFIRYAPLVAARGARVLVRCPAPLARLFSSAPGVDQVISTNQPLPRIDTYRALLSLPLVLGTRLDTIPAQTPYLRADENLVAAWRKRMGTSPGLKVGLVWAGNDKNPAGATRSTSLATFAPLAKVGPVRFFSLQKGPHAPQAKAPPPGLKLTDWMDDVKDFADTAALVANLDLVISIDTSVAHLAGALGKPVWLLNRYESEWRWMIGREDCPWYPTMRIFRQPRAGDWQSVLGKVVPALAELARGHAPAPARGQKDEITELRRKVEAEPSSAAAHYALAGAYRRALRMEEAVASQERAIALSPPSTQARYRFNHGLALLLKGDLAEGWKECEWRHAGAVELKDRARPGAPEWGGEDLHGKTLLLYSQQGRGDEIQFIRYAPMAAARGARVVIRCHPSLLRLFSGAPGIAQAVAEGLPLPRVDTQRDLMSLPLVFETTLETIPARVPYLRADEKLAAAWKKRFAPTGRLKVGLVWGGNEKNRGDAARSIPLTSFAPLARTAQVDLYSLQKGNYATQTKSPPPGMKITDWMGDARDFADTAAMVANLDLVISVDTAVAHLAGALGKPVWLLNRYESEWRWLLGRGDSPWYPTMRIFRQPRPGDWASVLRDIEQELAALAAKPRPAPAPAVPGDVEPGTRAPTAGSRSASLARTEKAIREALAKSPTATRHADLGEVLKAQGKPEKAIAAYRKAVELDPKDSRLRMSLGNLLADQENFKAAAVHYAEAAKLKPNLPAAHENLGTSLQKSGQYADAARSFRRALELKPGDADILMALGSCHVSLKDYRGALAPFREATKARPEAPEPHFRLGNSHFGLLELDPAVEHMDRAIALNPGHSLYHWALAISLLLKGDYARGWKEYEWRWEGASDAKHGKPSPGGPEWNGENVEGKTLLLHCEQGMGDAIQFIRYAPMVAARGARVIVRCHTPLVRLLEGAPGVDAVIPLKAPAPRFDLFRPLLSLPLLFDTRLDSIPARVPYLTADPARVAAWRKRLGPARGLKVGLAWGGNEQNRQDATRSCSLSLLAPLVRVPSVSFYSLQKGSYAAQAKAPPAGLKITDWMDEVKDFADTAALMANLDLVISVDTAVAHLAGALGRPVWLLNRYESEWRWLLDREDSPWYPTMRIFRQPISGDWPSVVDNVVEALAALAGVPAKASLPPSGKAPSPSSPDNRKRSAETHPAPADIVRLGRVEKAIREELEKSPTATRHADLGEVLKAQGRQEEAIAAYKKAVQLDPKDSRLHMSLGNLLADAGRMKPAKTHFSKAIALRPNLAAAHSNLATALATLGDRREALKCYERAIALEPGNADYQWSHTVGLLQTGDYAKGWPRFDEWRWTTKTARPKRYLEKPWTGEIVPGRRLLIWGEQGLGDELLFASMIGELADAGLKITLETQPRLIPLMQRSFPAVKAVTRAEVPAYRPADYDWQSPAGSLGRWLRPNLKSFPKHAGYLKADPERTAAYSARIRAPGPARIVGLAWKSGHKDMGPWNTIELEQWKDILRVPGVRFVDLQYGDTAEARGRLRKMGADILHLDDLDLFNDLEGVAALCSACDLVISSGNVTAPMAGALGKPVWTVLPIGPGLIWCWLAGRSDTPWFPSMRIFSQKKAGSWREPLSEVARSLQKFAKSK